MPGPANALNISMEGIVYFDGVGTFSDVSGGAPGLIPTYPLTGTEPTYLPPSLTSSFTSVATAASPYTVLSTDQCLNCDSTAGPITILLPEAPATNTTYWIKDATGQAGTNAITYESVSDDILIDGDTDGIINTAYGFIGLIFNGTSYQVLSTSAGSGGGGGGSPVSFSAYISTQQDGVTGDSGATPYQGIFDVITINTGSGYDASTGIFTCPVGGAGLYLLNAKYVYNTTETINYLSTFFELNSSLIVYSIFSGPGPTDSQNTGTCICFCLATLAEGDQVASFIQADGSSFSVNVEGGAQSFFSGVLLTSSGGGGGSVTIAGDSGSITGTSLNITGLTTAGITTTFQASGNTVTLNLTDSSSNTLLGLQSSVPTVTGTSNTGIGKNCFSQLTSGSSNVGLGYQSLRSSNSGNQNTAIGANASYSNTTGSGNTLLGYNSYLSGTLGSYNTAIGYLSATNYTTSESSNICLGNLGVVSDTHTIRIGNQGSGNNQQNKCFVAGIYGTTVGGTVAPVVVNSSGQLTQGSLGGLFSLNIVTITTSGTYTPSPGMSYCIIEAVGGGGGGAGNSGNGGNGTATTVGALLTCNGGGSGNTGGAGGVGGSASGGNLNLNGGSGFHTGNGGGNSFFAQGGTNQNGPGYRGSGGAGAINNGAGGGAGGYARLVASSTTIGASQAVTIGGGGAAGGGLTAGNAGGSGMVVITEYIL